MSKKTFEAYQQYQSAVQDSLLSSNRLLTLDKDSLRYALTFEQGVNHALLATQDKLQDRLDLLQKEIDLLLNNASEDQQGFQVKLINKDSSIESLTQKITAVKALLIDREERLSTFNDSLKISTDQASWFTRLYPGKLVLSIGENTLFTPKSTSRITKQGKSILDHIAEIATGFPEMQLQVIGHTDNRPVGRQGLDNWQYSALRAVSVVKYLTEEAYLSANRTDAIGKSEFMPLESNETTEGRARNRRIDIIIAPRSSDLERELRKVLN